MPQHCRFLLSAAALLAAPMAAATAQFPNTEIFVASLRMQGDSVVIGTPRQLTHHDGYDNQPWFSADGKWIWYTTQVGTQTDVARISVNGGEPTIVTHSPESEFSPSLVDHDTTMLVVRIEMDSTQHLWELTPDGRERRRARGDMKGVGYYALPDSARFVLFLADSLQHLVITSRGSSRVDTITAGVARSPKVVPASDAVSFVQEDSTGAWVRILDARSHLVTSVASAPGAAREQAWMPNGTLLMPAADTVFALHLGKATAFRPVAVFTDPMFAKITRLSVSPRGDMIAIVTELAAEKP